MIRQPIITVLGHVDHGKTTLLDWIRGTAVAKREAGLITQHVGATEIPLDIIKSVCGDLLERFKVTFTIPGILAIDTPGHEAFTNLRKRGGSIADLAVLVIDINQGIQPQTKEAIEILKTFKVPFVIAANKIDVIGGWKPHDKIFIKNINKQLPAVKEHYEKLFYQLLGQISELGFNSNLYTQVEDYKKEIAVIPISAKTGEGVAELLALLAGLSQKFLEKRLEIKEKEGCKATILEIKEEKGMGTVADVIVYDGVLSKGDYIVTGAMDEIIETQVRALLKPLPLSEIREKRARFRHVNEVHAATGVKILATDLNKALAGAPLLSVKEKQDLCKAKDEIEKEVESVLIETEETGIILKCDTLGSLEAVSQMIRNKGLPIKKASIGNINKTDVMLAKANLETEPLNAFILGFNVNMQDGAEKLAKEYKISVIVDKVVYKLLENYEEELENRKKQIELEKLKDLTWPAKFKILPGYVFRASKPAIFGVEMLAGKIKPGISIINEDGKEIGEIKTVESEGKKLEEAVQGEKVAISVPGITVGRQVKEEDILFSKIDEDSFRILKERKSLLAGHEIAVLKEIAEIYRREKPMWGV